jgi:hypothetical protein
MVDSDGTCITATGECTAAKNCVYCNASDNSKCEVCLATDYSKSGVCTTVTTAVTKCEVHDGAETCS